MTKLIELGLKKINKEIDLTWHEIGQPFGMSGEKVRSLVKNYRYKNGMVKGLYEKGKLRILQISDMHIPFHLPLEVYKAYVGKIDILVLNGDIQDCQSISKFIKKYRVPFIDELVLARNTLVDLINYLKPKKVIINYGNHELRLINMLSDKLQPDLLSLMPKTPLSLVCDTGFWCYDHQKNCKIFYEPLSEIFEDIEIEFTDDWYCRVGNTIFAHPSAYKNGILGTSEKAYLHFLQIGEKPFDCLVLAHTHASAMARYGRTFLYEAGCTCIEQDYVAGRLSRPQSQSFLFLVQDINGNFIYDESKLICL